MNRFGRVSVVYQKCLSTLLLLSLVSVGTLAPLQDVLAVEATIDASASATGAELSVLGFTSVFVSDQVGYRFYVNGGTETCVYAKTTDGGVNWSADNIVDSGTACTGVTVWYDKWTPGDGGDVIHILTINPNTGAESIQYNQLDTTTDTLLMGVTPLNVTAATGQTGSLTAGANYGSITKATNGIVYMVMTDNTDRYVVECSSNCGVGTSWSETGNGTQLDAQPDYSLLMPLPDGDILLINMDVSADDFRSKVWDDNGGGVGSWDATWTTINANAPDNATYDPGFSATVDTDTGDVYLAYIDWATTGTVGGNNDDIKTVTYSAGLWTNNADVVTNTTRGLTGVSIGIDGNTGDVYTVYSAQVTAGTVNTANVYWKSSTNNMAAWGAENGPVNASADEIYGVSINGYDFERLHASWYEAAPDDMLGDTIADIQPIFIVTASDNQRTDVRPQTNDVYMGGKFVLDENIASRDVTSITITETGGVDAANNLDNIKLYYDLDTAAPYDCESESYGGSESQFGTTDTDGFSAANGTATFTGTVSVSPTQAMCVYTVLDVTKYATEFTTIDIEIANPETDVLVSGGVVAVPATSVAIAGETVIKPNTNFKVQRGTETITGDTLTITAGVDYEAPSSASSAFIRITNTGHTGAGRNTGGGTSNADDTTVYITNPANITTSITFARGAASVNNTRVSWEIVEYRGEPGGDNEIVVRQQEGLAFASGGATLTTSAVSGIVDDTDVVVFITGQRNQNTGATVYNRGASTAAWNAGTNQAVFTRAATGNIADVSYAVVEFTGSNWKIQRAEHTYSAVGTTQTQSITAVNSLSRTFLHTQKRFSVSTHANFGHEVWLSGIGQVSFLLDAAATTPAGQVAVAWVIENTQTLGIPMDVTRSNGTIASGGTAPQSNVVSIGKTLSDTTVASIFTNNRSTTNTNTWPEPILGVGLISSTQYELWRSDTGAALNYRTEVVEWPTAERKLEQNYYRLYVNNDSITPTDPWPAGVANLGENTEMTPDDEPTAEGDVVRIRMSVTAGGARIPALGDAFKLQYAPRTSTCSAVSSWLDVGAIGSTTAHWRGFNATPIDGTDLSVDPPDPGDLLLSVSDVAGSYVEENNSPTNPHLVLSNDDVEYDWLVEQTAAALDKTSYCFRMVEDTGVQFVAYNNYPVIRTVGYEPLVTNWRWYDDETSLTPVSALGGENVSPSNIVFQNALKLRLVLRESSGADGLNVKFALQYSEYADFSQGVTTVTSTTTCAGDSLWCFFDGTGTDNAVIQSSVISDADSCVAGVGAGCGTHNESANPAGVTFDQAALTSTEFEFTIKHDGARSNRVYYFRLYDLTNDEIVGVADTFSNPSLVTEGANMNFTVTGLDAGTATAGITTDATTTPTAVSFSDIPFNTDLEAAQRVSIYTNATDGYQILKYADSLLTNTYGDTISAITSTNAVPAGWSSACLFSAPSCFGYHTTDGTLDGGSTRFAPTDSYAALETTPREVMYSSIPTVGDTSDIVFKLRVGNLQPGGDYTTNLTYIAVPVH